MTSDKRVGALIIAFATIVLSACNGSNGSEPGLTVHFAEVHTEAHPGVEPITPAIIPSSASIQGGYDQANLEKHPIRDVNGRALVLYRAYLALDGVELVPCLDLSRLPRWFIDRLIPAARAHAGHGSEPVGGRAVDKPNVIDIVTQEGFVLPLGDRAIAPGRYCGLRVALVRLSGDAYGKPGFAAASSDDPTTVPEVPELAGLTFAIRADYCAEANGTGQCTRRVKVDIDDGGLPEPGELVIDFDQPLEISAVLREGFVALGIAYGEWVHDVDVTRLDSDVGEVQKLLDNIAASIHINSLGLGELPANIAP